MMSKGKKVRSVVVVNAAVLLEAQTEGRYNEVWLCMVPFETVIFANYFISQTKYWSNRK